MRIQLLGKESAQDHHSTRGLEVERPGTTIVRDFSVVLADGDGEDLRLGLVA